MKLRCRLFGHAWRRREFGPGYICDRCGAYMGWDPAAHEVERAAVLALRRACLLEGRPCFPIRVTPTDLAAFGLQPWVGRRFGMECVESPIVRAGGA